MLYTFIDISASDTALMWANASNFIKDIWPIVAIVGGILLVGLIFSIFKK